MRFSVAPTLESPGDLGTNKPLGVLCMEVTVIDIELHAERLEARDVHVEFT